MLSLNSFNARKSKRSKYIAETYLKNAVLVKDISGVQVYTGEYKGKKYK